MGERSNIVSSFTVIKGALIPETYAAFRSWDLTKGKRENLDDLKLDNPVGATSANWLRDVAKVLNRRWEPDGRDRALVRLAQMGADLEVWKPIALWHMTRDEFLVRDFLVNWLFPAFEKGTWQVRTEDLFDYLRRLEKRKDAVIEHAWTVRTLHRVAAGLLKIATDFGLLVGSQSRRFASYYLPETAFLYLLHALHEEVGNARKLLDSPEWRLFLMRRENVERELLRLHQFRKLSFEAAGSMVRLELPYRTASEFVEGIQHG